MTTMEIKDVPSAAPLVEDKATGMSTTKKPPRFGGPIFTSSQNSKSETNIVHSRQDGELCSEQDVVKHNNKIDESHPVSPDLPELGRQAQVSSTESTADVVSEVVKLAREIDLFLGVTLARALQRLDAAFTLPETSAVLSRSLRNWSKEVELLFSTRARARKRASTLLPADGVSGNHWQYTWTWKGLERSDEGNKSGTSRWFAAERMCLGVKFVSHHGAVVDNQPWKDFYHANGELSRSLQTFLSVAHYLSDHRSTGCVDAAFELVVTLEEMCLVLQDHLQKRLAGQPDGQDSLGFSRWRNAAADRGDSDLRQFMTIRLRICQVQLSSLLEALKDFAFHEMNLIGGDQSRAFDKLRNVAAASSFFAAVVAATLTYSLEPNVQPSSLLGSGEVISALSVLSTFSVISALWLFSLVASITSAITSFVELIVRKSSSLWILPRRTSIKFGVTSRPLIGSMTVGFKLPDPKFGFSLSVTSYFIGLLVFVIATQEPAVWMSTCIASGLPLMWVAWVWLTHRSTFRQHQQWLKEIAAGDKSSRTGDKPARAGSDPISSGHAELDRSQWGRVNCMKMTSDGRWVLVCHEHAFAIYDSESMKESWKVLGRRGRDEECCPEHVTCQSFAPGLELLLIRTKGRLGLWMLEASGSNEGDQLEEFKFKNLKCCDMRDKEDDHFKYVRWINKQDFLAVSGEYIHHWRVKSDKHHKPEESSKVESLSLRNIISEGYQVTQVYPMDSKTGKIEWMMCLGTKSLESEKLHKVLQFGSFKRHSMESQGVDFVLVLNRKHAGGNAAESQPGSLPTDGGEVGTALHLEQGVGHTSLDFKSEQGMQLESNTQDAILPTESKPELFIAWRRILPQNIRNLKFRQCGSRNFVIVNYHDSENKYGTMAPDLWEVKTSNSKSSTPDSEIITTCSLGEVFRPNLNPQKGPRQWGEASFVGSSPSQSNADPTQVMLRVACAVDDALEFVELSLGSAAEELTFSKPQSSLGVDFDEFFHPIFTLQHSDSDDDAHTSFLPTVAVTDLDGCGPVRVSKCKLAEGANKLEVRDQGNANSQ